MSSYFSRAGAQSGQVGIIIILLMVVMLSIGITIAARTSEELSLQKQGEDSTRVFRAAEAGVERALSTDLNFAGESLTGQTFISNDNTAKVDYTISKQRALSLRVAEGTSVHVQLAEGSTPPPSSVTVYWAKETQCSQDPASVVVSIFSADTSANPAKYTSRTVVRSACDRGDEVPVGDPAEPGVGLVRKVTIPLQAQDVFLRVKALHNDTQMIVRNVNNESLPVQAYQIRAEAKNQTGNETRTVEVYQTLPGAPSILDYTVFSGTSIMK